MTDRREKMLEERRLIDTGTNANYRPDLRLIETGTDLGDFHEPSRRAARAVKVQRAKKIGTKIAKVVKAIVEIFRARR